MIAKSSEDQFNELRNLHASIKSFDYKGYCYDSAFINELYWRQITLNEYLEMEAVRITLLSTLNSLGQRARKELKAAIVNY